MTPTLEETDERLVQAVLTGDRDVFAVLVERYKRGISNFIGASVRTSADVADLSQETFLRAYAHLGTFNPDLGKFSTWVYHIARNVVRTHLGKSQRRPQTADIGEERTLENMLPDVSLDADPMGGILRAEAESEVRSALLRQHGLSNDRNDDGPIAWERKNADPSRQAGSRACVARARYDCGDKSFAKSPGLGIQ
jgi:RNA polymerase sigma factor (sigma-70 family)